MEENKKQCSAEEGVIGRIEKKINQIRECIQTLSVNTEEAQKIEAEKKELIKKLREAHEKQRQENEANRNKNTITRK